MRLLAPCLVLTLAAPAALLPQAPAPAQQPDSTPPRTARLFRDKEPVTMWLQADFKTVLKDRDTSEANTRRYPAVLRFLNEKGDTVSFDVHLGTRGNYRLQMQRAHCAFVPLKVFFDKEKTKGSVFGGEGSLKLTTHCNNGERFEQNVLVEYAINSMYNLFTPISLNVRLATITYVDPGNPSFTVTRAGFWSEDQDGMAKRNRGKILMTKGGSGADMEPRQSALTDVFQYMIGNTDFSLYGLHNIRIVQSDTAVVYYPMAYDFDFAGLVDAPYARPDYRLPIKRVTDRLYRGCAHPPELFDEVAGLFKSKKTDVYGVLGQIKGLTPARLKEATSYLDEFYKTISDPREMKREFRSVCQEGT